MFLKYVEEGGEKDFVFFKKLDSRSSLLMDLIHEIEMSSESHLKDGSGTVINVVTLETPVSTLRGLLLASNHDHLSFSKKELWKLLELDGILKNHEEVTARNASKEYLKVVGISYFGNTDEVNRLMDKVESAFIKHFGNGNRRKGMTADWLLTCSHCDPYVLAMVVVLSNLDMEMDPRTKSFSKLVPLAFSW
ncbi:Phosphate transporter PHO1 3 [Glycine soja]